MVDGYSPQSGRPSSSLHFMVGQISGKLDAILLDVTPRIQALEGRVGGVERKVWYVTGASGVILVLLSSLEVLRYAVHR